MRKFRKNDRVKEETLGKGTILRLIENTNKAEVKFDQKPPLMYNGGVNPWNVEVSKLTLIPPEIEECDCEESSCSDTNQNCSKEDFDEYYDYDESDYLITYENSDNSQFKTGDLVYSKLHGYGKVVYEVCDRLIVHIQYQDKYLPYSQTFLQCNTDVEKITPDRNCRYYPKNVIEKALKEFEGDCRKYSLKGDQSQILRQFFKQEEDTEKILEDIRETMTSIKDSVIK